TVQIGHEEKPLAPLLDRLDTTALVIIKDGTLIFEEYYKDTQKDDLRISWSVAKSFASGLFGQALENGQIKSLDETVDSYVPELKGSAYEGATIRNVMNMSSGVKFNEDYLDPKSDINKMGRVLGLGQSMDEFSIGLKQRQFEPGTKWQYVSIDTHVLAMVLRAARGKSLHEMFNETYSANLGFGRAPYYLTDGEDVAFALGGLNLRTRDYAKFGQLFLQGGQWADDNGVMQQIIPSDWVRESTSHSAPELSGRGVGYGYQWWVPMPQEKTIHEGDFFAVGIYGQYIYVNPAMGVVIAKNAADREFTEATDGYPHSMNVNIDMMRSLAAHYGEKN
ncbi:MAG: serine hydrolase, partial [Litorimonas sp.]